MVGDHHRVLRITQAQLLLQPLPARIVPARSHRRKQTVFALLPVHLRRPSDPDLRIVAHALARRAHRHQLFIGAVQRVECAAMPKNGDASGLGLLVGRRSLRNLLCGCDASHRWVHTAVAQPVLRGYLLSVATRTIPVGTAYAVWVGIGAAGTALYGVLALGEDRSLLRMLCFALIVAGIAGLKLLSEVTLAKGLAQPQQRLGMGAADFAASAESLRLRS